MSAILAIVEKTVRMCVYVCMREYVCVCMCVYVHRYWNLNCETHLDGDGLFLEKLRNAEFCGKFSVKNCFGCVDFEFKCLKSILSHDELTTKFSCKLL